MVFIFQTVIKYFSLIYIGLAQNITPLVTIVMSYFMTGERLKSIDIILIFITFIGVTFISYGFYLKELEAFNDENLVRS